jgi:membrane-associated phospholipid phosphatase
MRDLKGGPHSLAFGLYLAAMTAGCLLHAVWLYTAFFAALLACLVLLTCRADRNPLAPWTIAADAFYPIVLNLAFPAMGVAVPAVRSKRFDATLFALDARLLGGSWSVRLEPLVRPALTEVMSACYLFFMPLLFFHLVRFFFWRRERRAPFLAGLFTVYGVGFLGYLLVPAAGPYGAFPGLFTVPLDGGVLWHLNHFMVARGSNGVDVFPSLHTAVSVYILGFAYRHARREFWWLLLPVAGICVSTVYLRYHYLVDVVCGFVLAALGIAASRYQARRLSQQSSVSTTKREFDVTGPDVR